MRHSALLSLSIALPLMLGIAAACSQEPRPAAAPAAPARPVVVAGYDLGRPIRSFVLPHVLREISGIAAVDQDTVACEQDEKGMLYFFDLRQGQIVREAKFGPKGDYEGLARIGADYWLLRSDGLLLHAAPAGERYDLVETIALRLPPTEYEGLAYDRAHERLIIAPKSVAKDKDEKGLRPLFAWDLATNQAGAEPWLVLRVDDVLAAAAALGVAVPTRITEKARERPQLRLHLSEVAVHPETGDLWLLSAVDHALLVTDQGGKVRGLHFFAAEELPQPEAATFLPGGEFVIASEGAGGDGVLRVYGRAK